MFTKPIYHLGLILFPITALIILITLFYKTGNAPVVLTNNNLQLHILSSFISYGFLGLAGLEAILLSRQEKKLRDCNITVPHIAKLYNKYLSFN